MPYELRPYQSKSITECREAFKSGAKEVILMSPTGSGKSIIIRKIIESAKGRVLFVVHRTILIKQMRETLKGLDVEIATLQKISKNQTERYNLIIHDECHYAYNSKLRNNLNCNYYLGLSATPITPDGYSLKADKIISFLQMSDLIDLGFAVPFKVISTSKVDTSKLKSSGGNFNVKESYELMSKSTIQKDILKNFEKYCLNKKTIIYAVNIQHAEELQKEFSDNGHKCVVIHSKKKCEDIINDFKDGKVKILINVSILTVGFDDGDVEALLLASPTKSLIQAIQIYGRVSRLPVTIKKEFGLVVDCANVIANTLHPMQKIDFNRVKSDKTIKCNKCKAEVKLIDRKIEIIDRYEYIIRSTYFCNECNNKQIIENIKLFNLEICEGCGNEFESKDGLQLTQGDNSINFDIECAKCGNLKKFREILLSDEELKEVTLKEAMENTETWEQVLLILKAECKKDGYHWRFSLRILDHLKKKKYTPRECVDKIKMLRLSNKKTSMLMYI